MALSSRGGHSARVTMQLQVNGVTLRVAQMGRNFLLLQETANHPAGAASITMRVDENERTWSVVLPTGISPASKRVPIRAA